MSRFSYINTTYGMRYRKWVDSGDIRILECGDGHIDFENTGKRLIRIKFRGQETWLEPQEHMKVLFTLTEFPEIDAINNGI